MPSEEGTDIPAREFIAHLIDTQDYCVFEVKGIEWHYVWNKLLDEVRDADEARPPPTMEEPGQFGILYAGPSIFYWAERGAIPAERLAEAFGIPTGTMDKALYIRLGPLDANQPPTPEPTVDYYGLA